MDTLVVFAIVEAYDKPILSLHIKEFVTHTWKIYISIYLLSVTENTEIMRKMHL